MAIGQLTGNINLQDPLVIDRRQGDFSGQFWQGASPFIEKAWSGQIEENDGLIVTPDEAYSGLTSYLNTFDPNRTVLVNTGVGGATGFNMFKPTNVSGVLDYMQQRGTRGLEGPSGRSLESLSDSSANYFRDLMLEPRLGEPSPGFLANPSAFGTPEAYNVIYRNGQFEQLTDQNERQSIGASVAQKLAADRASNRGFLRKMGPLLPLAVPLVAGAGIGLAGLGGAGAAGATGVSAGSVVPSSGGFLGGLGTNFGTKAALSGALKGGIGGFLSGGDFGSALKGAGFGALGGGFGSAIGGSLGLGSLGQQTLTGALTGAAGGLGAGNTRDALLGGLMGGGGSYVMGGGNVPGLGRVAGAPLSGGMQGPTQGSGVLGAVTRNAGTAMGGGSSSLGGSLGGGGMLGNILKGGGSLYGMKQTEDTNEEIKRRLMEAAGQQEAYLNQAQGLFDPYQQAGVNANQQLAQALSAGFNPSDLASDPSYQFRLQQGEQALGRQAAAGGMTQSGAALKAAQEFGQGLASQEYQNAFDRRIAQNSQLANMAGQGMQAAGAQSDLFGALGGVAGDRAGIEAQIMAANNMNRQKTLAEILGIGGNSLGRMF